MTDIIGFNIWTSFLCCYSSPKETSAYQKMMMGAQPDKGRDSKHSTFRDDSSDEEEDEDDSEDEIEKAARIKQDSPSSHHAK